MEAKLDIWLTYCCTKMNQEAISRENYSSLTGECKANEANYCLSWYFRQGGDCTYLWVERPLWVSLSAHIEVHYSAFHVLIISYFDRLHTRPLCYKRKSFWKVQDDYPQVRKGNKSSRNEGNKELLVTVGE